ncbi:MAG: hypothetical protein DRI75_10725 [Bacteroidetes bacterium]|nr:MAG: hypothetical protein DRI75_10725 [Bacteroidota bacterium]
MKKILIIPVLLLFLNSNAQSFQDALNTSGGNAPFNNLTGNLNGEYQTLTGNENEWSKIMGVFYQFDDIRFGKIGLDGSVYLFDNWENKGVIVVGNKRYAVPNINFHINQDLFLTKMENDSTFVYDFKGIDKIIVNSRAFKSIYNTAEGKNKIYEIVYGSKDLILLKRYSVKLIQASPNPMVNRTKSKIKRSSNYYLMKDGGVIPFKLKKSNILNLINSEQTQRLEQYVKDYKLSYKKEKDVNKILDYISKS